MSCQISLILQLFFLSHFLSFPGLSEIIKMQIFKKKKKENQTKEHELQSEQQCGVQEQHHGLLCTPAFSSLRTHATPLLAPLGKNINTNNAFGYYSCSEACCGQLAWHHEALGDQRVKKMVRK